MIKESVTLKETVEFLNSLIKIDSFAINALFSMRIPCNEEMAYHETVQVRQLGDEFWQVGMIGVLNGLFGIDKNGWGHISADYEDGKIIKFDLLTDHDVHTIIGDKTPRCPHCKTTDPPTEKRRDDELYIFCERCKKTVTGGLMAKE